MPRRPTILITVGQGPTALAVGAGGGCLDIFTLIYPFSFLSPSLWETARYRLKYCLKGPLNPKQPTNQPTNQILLQGLSEPEFYGDLVYKFRIIIGKNDFPYHFKKIIVRYKKIGYNLNVMRQTACLVVNPIKVNNFAYLFNYTTVDRTSD